MIKKAAATLGEHLSKPSTTLGTLDRVFPNRRAFPWQTPLHPLLQQTQVIKDDGVTKHKAVFHTALMSVFKDHTIAGRCIFPGAGFVEMALAASATQNISSTFDDSKTAFIVLQNIAYRNPMDLEIGSTLTCDISESGAEKQVEFRSTSAPDHVLCSINSMSRENSSTLISSETVFASPLSDTRKRCAEEVCGISDMHAEMAKRGTYGPFFQLVTQVWRNATGDEVLARIRVPAALSNEQWIVHPAVLDCICQAGVYGYKSIEFV